MDTAMRMFMPVRNDTEIWTRDEIVDALTRVAKSRFGMSLNEFVEAVKTDRLDICEHTEMVALLNMLSKDDTIFMR
jgi:hypothetical protein